MFNCQLGCFGKLPIHADFIRYHASGLEVRALDQWFQKGIYWARYKLGEGWKGDFLKADAWNFVYRPEGTDSYLVGVYSPSRDKGGRGYPFFVFACVDTSPFEESIGLAPLVFENFLKEAGKVAREGWSGKNLREFLEDIERRAMQIPDGNLSRSCLEGYMHFLHATTLGEFFTMLYGAFDHPRKYLLHQNMIAALTPLRQRPGVPYDLGLKFPLVPRNRALLYDISLWITMVAKVVGRKTGETLFLWNRQPTIGPPALMCYPKTPSPKSFVFFIRPEMDCEHCFDLSPENGRVVSEVRQEMREPHWKILENSALPLVAFLDGIGEF